MTDLIVGIIAAVALVAGAIISAPRLLRDPVNTIAKQSEIYTALPDKSPAKAALLLRIEQQVAQLDSESSARRNPYGIFWSSIFFIIAAACTWLVYSAGGWWWLTAPVLLLLWLGAGIGMYQAVKKVPRAANGQWLSYQQKRAAKTAQKAARK